MPGGSVGYPSERLFEEVAYLAYHFHWSHEDILTLDHAERQRWVEEVGKLNQRINSSSPLEEQARWR